jgi:hypothetical protein
MAGHVSQVNIDSPRAGQRRQDGPDLASKFR